MMLSLDEALDRACADVAIATPKRRTYGTWLTADTLSRNGKGDGRVMLQEDHVTAYNWQTGDKATVWLTDRNDPAQRARSRQITDDSRSEQRAKAARAAEIAGRIIGVAKPAKHPYLTGKGFPDEMPLVIGADDVRRLAGDYAVPANGKRAIVVPARLGLLVSSAQLIWEDGTKKFIFGGEMGGAFHRIASGMANWLCEGFATGLSLRTALRGLSRTDTILICFSASNLVKVARAVRGSVYVAADHDPVPKSDPYGGLGTGEHFARQTGKPFIMPASIGMDLNDLHQRENLFAVQGLVTDLLRRQS